VRVAPIRTTATGKACPNGLRRPTQNCFTQQADASISIHEQRDRFNMIDLDRPSERCPMLPVHGGDLGSTGDEGLNSVCVVRPGRSMQRCPPILGTQIRVGSGSK